MILHWKSDKNEKSDGNDTSDIHDPAKDTSSETNHSIAIDKSESKQYNPDEDREVNSGQQRTQSNDHKPLNNLNNFRYFKDSNKVPGANKIISGRHLLVPFCEFVLL